MKIEDLVGTWNLIGSLSISSEIQLTGEDSSTQSVNEWLRGKSDELVDSLESTQGLILTILADGRFVEEKTGNPNVPWYDQEGVLQSEVTPFHGYLRVDPAGAHLMPDDVPSWATPEQKSGLTLRYDDGDTKISDRIERRDDRLIRTVSVVTDELYLDRTLMVYGK